jgi:hypothetical protein
MILDLSARLADGIPDYQAAPGSKNHRDNFPAPA